MNSFQEPSTPPADEPSTPTPAEIVAKALQSLPPNNVESPEAAQLAGRSKPRKLRTLSPLYLAGLLDGEGSFIITYALNREGTRETYRARVSVTNTDRFVLECLRYTLGGSISKNGRRYGKNKHAWKWSLDAMDEVEALVQQVRRHLVVKRRVARVLLAFILYRRRVDHTRRGLAAFRRRIQKLNKRGFE